MLPQNPFKQFNQQMIESMVSQDQQYLSSQLVNSDYDYQEVSHDILSSDKPSNGPYDMMGINSAGGLSIDISMFSPEDQQKFMLEQ